MNTQTKMTPEEMQALIQRLEAENASLKASDGPTIKLNAEKGTVSVYGLGRFPVSLYRSQWLKLFGYIEAIKAFLKVNAVALDAVDAKRAAAKAAGKASA